MATLLGNLPAPVNYVPEQDAMHAQDWQAPKKTPPPAYGKRQGFVPRTIEDFGDGGAFPEIHVAQYPMDMGRKRDKERSTLGISTDKDGNVDHTSIVTHGAGKGVITFSRYQDLVPKVPGQEGDLSRPDEEELAETEKKTKAAMDRIVGNKVDATHVSHAATAAAGGRKEQYLRYTPNVTNESQAGGAGQRIIHMVELPVDPMEPPKFKHKRVPKGPGSPPVPVMHSPPRKVTVKDQQEWKIPPCISNWKNAKGYTIPLDKRLAADGRDTQETTINDKFAKLSESLYVAERVARDDINKRAEAMKKLATKKAEEKDQQLRRLAQRVIDEKDAAAGDEEETEGESEGRKQREGLRDERKRERERDYRIAMAAPEKRSKLMRDRDRDVSEQIALGQATTAGASEAEYDHRLYNQSAGMTAGFGNEEAYNVYDKPLFKGTSQIYKPTTRKEEYDTQALVDNLQKGGDGKEGGGGRGGRPVQFEKEADPFGLDEFLTEAKKGKSTDKIGNRGGMVG